MIKNIFFTYSKNTKLRLRRITKVSFLLSKIYFRWSCICFSGKEPSFFGEISPLWEKLTSKRAKFTMYELYQTGPWFCVHFYNSGMQQISTEGVQGETRLGRQGNPLGNVQEISIWPYKQMVYAQPGACPRKWLA